MKDNITLEKATEFALRIINLCDYLKKSQNEYRMSDQLFRSGTGIGANIAESVYASSNADFISKLQIALKEASETKYWLVLLFKSAKLTECEFHSIMTDCESIIKMLTSSIRKLKSKP